MGRFVNLMIVGLFCILTVFLLDVCAQEVYETTPKTNNGKKWRIGYYEGGPYSNYQSILKTIVVSLMDSGWIQHAPIPKCQDESETRTLWNFLSIKIQSDYIEFIPDAYWTSKWNDEVRKKIKHDIIKRLKNNKDIDLMLAFGTWAGQDLANNQHNTPTMVISSSDAVNAGIIKSINDSGFDHVHAMVDPNKSERQIRIFYDVVGFKKLGIAYENDKDGRSYAAVDDVQKLSDELGFEMIECQLPIESGIVNEDIELVKCYEQLATKIDSMYITDYGGLTKQNITKLLSPLFEYKIPTFAQTRYDLVKNGVLMSAGRSDYNADGKFYSQTMAKIMNGAKPRHLPQKFESPLKIAINLESAKKIGFRFPLDILAGAFKMYETIQKPENEK